MADVRTRTRATVRVTLEIDLSDRWGDDCSTGQVYRQARSEAIGMLRRIPQLTHARLVEEPSVTAITCEDRRD
jgi:hypothetical protein